MRGRPAKPMYPDPAPAGDPDLAAAFADMAGGALSYAAASEFAGGLHEKTIAELVRRGEVEAFEVGRRTMVVKASLQRWLARQLAAGRRRRKLDAAGIPTEGEP